MDGAPTEFKVFAGVLLAVIVLFVILGVVNGVRRSRALREAGLDPRLTPAEQLAAQRMHGTGARPPRPLEERLAELDDLLRREVISPEEHRAARLAALGAD